MSAALPFDELADRYLDARRSSNLLRSRRNFEPIDATHVRDAVTGRKLIAFCTNDYLGLASHPRVAAALRDSTAVGSGAAPLISGRSPAHAELERTLADWKGVDDAVLLPSGYQANVAALQAVAGVIEAAERRPRFLLDKLAHASLIDAARLVSSSRDSLRVFPHNDLEKLDRLLAERDADQHDVIVTESVFSMDGDEALLREIAELKRRHRATLVLDEAHATGLFGPSGAGLASELGVSRDVDVGIATLSKALGASGGAVYGSSAVVESVVNAGRAYLFSTATPPSLARATCEAIAIARDEPERRARALANARRLRDALISRSLRVRSSDRSPIIPIELGDERAALDAARSLEQQGFLVVAVRPPTVPRGTSRLRVTVSSEHSAEQISALSDAIATSLSCGA
jgi:8-amino-7-oxononanoate synthase